MNENSNSVVGGPANVDGKRGLSKGFHNKQGTRPLATMSTTHLLSRPISTLYTTEYFTAAVAPSAARMAYFDAVSSALRALRICRFATRILAVL